MNIRHDVLRRGWQSMASVVLGFWLFVSPWGLHYAAQGRAADAAAWIIGFLLVAMSVLRSFVFYFSEGIGDCVLGVCLVISPWELDYAAAMMPTTNAVVTGLLLILLSLSVDWRQAPRRAKPSLRAGHAASHGGSPGGRGGCRP